MGALLSIPLLGSLTGLAGTVAMSCVSGLAFFCTSKAASVFFKSCNCNSSVATRVGFGLLFMLNSILAWIMLTPYAIRKLEGIGYDYIKMSCKEGTCYGVLAVHRICFALAFLHLILSALLVNVSSTRSSRSAIQNGWWGLKILSWIALVILTFFIPNEFFMWYSHYIAMIGSAAFILIGLVLLVDFAHAWSERCHDNWEETGLNVWKYVLFGSTLAAYVVTITLTAVDYSFFGKSGCGLNQFFITINLLLCILVTGLSVHPLVQEANPGSGLAQSGLVAAYCSYLITSALANYDDTTPGANGRCNPFTAKAAGARTSMVVAGAMFTFIAIAYSTTRAATQSRALVGRQRAKLNSIGGEIQLTGGSDDDFITSQPQRRDPLRTQAILAAIEAGSLPASALEEDLESDDGLENVEDRDDERTCTKYNYSWFHIIFALACMYVAMLLTNWNIVKAAKASEVSFDASAEPVKIGRSGVAMWMRIVSSWACLMLYGWSLVAPVVMPDRFD